MRLSMVLAGLVALVCVASCGSSEPPMIVVSSALEHTGTFSGAPGAVQIEWTPAFMLTNRGSTAVSVLDVETNFPYAVDADSKEQIDLVPSAPTATVEIFRSLNEIRDGRPTAVMSPPVQLEAGETIYIRPKQMLMMTQNGVPITFRRDLAPIDYLGPFLRLPLLDGGGYRCTLGARFPVIVHTDRGDVPGEVAQAILPVGCSLLMPK